MNNTRLVVIGYYGNELSEESLNQIVDAVSKSSGVNIAISELDYSDIVKVCAAAAAKDRKETLIRTMNEEKSPLQHALIYIGTKFDTSSSLATFITQLVIAMRNEENSSTKETTKAVHIISTYDNPKYREKVPEYKKYGFNHAQIDAIRNLHNHFQL